MAQLLLTVLMTLPVGERLTYRVKYGPLTAGTLTLEIAGVTEVAGESCYRLVSHLKSNPSYSSLFFLDDTIESFARVSDLVTLRSAKSVHEGKYMNRTTVDFDYNADVASYSDDTVVTVPGETRDALTLWYYFRTVDFGGNDEFSVPSHVDKKNYKVAVSLADAEEVTTRAGTFQCLVVDMKSSGPAGSGRIYLSDDEWRVPVIIKTRMPLGFISAYLVSIEGSEE